MSPEDPLPKVLMKITKRKTFCLKPENYQIFDNDLNKVAKESKNYSTYEFSTAFHLALLMTLQRYGVAKQMVVNLRSKQIGVD